MRTAYAVAFAASLLAAPAMGQVVIQTPGSGDAAAHQAAADQHRANARAEHQAAQMNADVGNYDAAAENQAAARHDWHAAHRQEDRAAGDSGSTVVIGR
jgi:hypothetical protein